MSKLAVDDPRCCKRHKNTSREYTSKTMFVETCLDCGATRTVELKLRLSKWQSPNVRLNRYVND